MSSTRIAEEAFIWFVWSCRARLPRAPRTKQRKPSLDTSNKLFHKLATGELR